LLLFSVALWLLWEKNKNTIFGQLHGNVSSLATVMMELFFSFVALSLLCCLPIFLLDSLAEYYFHMKNLKMDKNEVKREYKEQEGNPEIKQHRRQSHMELLSEQIKFDIKQSSFVLANPTHIAIGVYFNPGISPVPLVSVLETNHRARAVIAYARQCGIPVVRDIPLARGLFKFVHRYSMIPLSHVDGIFRILTWLLEVETNAMHSADSTGISSSDPSRTPP
jgi:type III secretion protein U